MAFWVNAASTTTPEPSRRNAQVHTHTYTHTNNHTHSYSSLSCCLLCPVENPGQTTGPVHNGRSSGGGGTRGSARGGVMIRKRRPNLIDAPDDSFFVVSRETRRARRLLSRSQLRRACRQPCEQITLRKASQALAQGPLLAPPHPHPSLRMRGPIVIHD
uniref:Uncharacterized protein n=1 Tax=Hucho hucho TaxID=62062 RepID=A0A4W5KW62_9TELE